MEIFDFKFNIFGIIFLGLFLLNGFLIFEIARKKRSSPSITWALNLLILAAIASAAQSFVTLSNSEAPFSFWSNVRYFCLMLVPPSFLAFVAAFTGKDSLLKKYFAMYLLFIPTVFIIFMLTQTDLIYIRSFNNALQTAWGPVQSRGPMELFLLTPYFLLYLGTSFYMLLKFYSKNKDMAYRKEVAVVIVSLLLPALGGVLFQQILPNLFKVAAFPAYVPFVAVMNAVILFLVSRHGIFVLAPRHMEMESVKSTGNGVFLVDAKGNIKFVNEAGSSMVGYSFSQLQNKALTQLLPNKQSEKAFEQILNCKNSNNKHSHILEIDLKTATGTMITVNLLCSSLGQGNTSSGHLLIMTNLENMGRTRREIEKQLEEFEQKNASLADTEKAMINILEDAKELQEALKFEKANVEKKVQERTRDLQEKTKALSIAKDAISEGWMQLQKEKARLDASIRGLPLGVVMTDQKGAVIIANKLVGEIFGMAKVTKMADISDALGKDFDLVKYHNESIEKKKMFEFEDIVWKDKHLRIFLDPISMESSKKDVIGVVFLVEDITEAKVVERSKDEFFSIASHELRTPLTAIKGNTSLIQEYYAEKLKDQELKDMISDIHESSVRLIGIVNDFLDMSRLEQGKMVFNSKKVDVAQICTKVVRDLGVIATTNKLYIKLTGEKVMAVKGDEEKIEQIITNLVGNSLKFTEKGGITIEVTKQGDFAKIFVTDTGRGIPLTNQNLLFRKFQQAGSSLLTRDTTKGTGLGLYISKLMAIKMAGNLSLLKSEENKGSTFSLILPLFKDTDKVAETKVEPPSAPAPAAAANA